jgi:hypothetical protein
MMLFIPLCRKLARLRYVSQGRWACIETARGGSNAVRLFHGGPVACDMPAAPSVFVAEHKGAWKWSAEVAEHRTEIFAEAA